MNGNKHRKKGKRREGGTKEKEWRRKGVEKEEEGGEGGKTVGREKK